MNRFRPFVAMVAALVALGTASANDLLSGDPPRGHFWLETSPNVSVESVLRGLGRVLTRDAKRKAVLVKVAPKLDYVSVLTNVRRQHGVAAVVGNAEQVLEREPDFRSLASLDVYLNAVKRRDSERGRGEEAGEEGGVDYIEAYRYFMHQRAFPNDRIDPMAYAPAVAHRDRMPVGRLASEPARDRQGIAPSVSWSFIGPKNLDVPYTRYYGVRPVAGRVSRIAFDPVTPGKYYVAGAIGGLFRSTDYGVTWTSLSQSFESLSISSIAISPSDGNVIYVGGGDAHGSMSFFSFGLKKSTDGGATWTNLSVPWEWSHTVSDIVIDPDDPSIVTICAGGRNQAGYIYRSDDGGTTWTKPLNMLTQWSDLSIGAAYSAGGRFYYASAGGLAETVWRSDDHGLTWKMLSTPEGTNLSEAALVAASKVNPTTVYAMFPSRKKIYKSTNAGNNWFDSTNDYPTGNEIEKNYNWKQHGYNYSLETSSRTVDGVTKDVVYAGNIDISFSVDGGTSWRTIGGPTYSEVAVIHNDQHAVAVSPTTPNVVLIGNDGGVNRFTYTPSNDTWVSSPLNKGLPITMFYTGDWHPTNSNYMLGGAQDNATPVALGSLDNWENVGGGDGAGCAINPVDPSNQYTSGQNCDAVMTTDYWANATNIAPPMTNEGERIPFIGKIWMDPTNTNVIYMGSQYLYRFTRSGATGTWESKLGDQDFGSGMISKVAVAKTDSSRIYVATDNSGIFMSTDGGETWASIRPGSGDLPFWAITDISVNPSNRSDILVAFGGTSSKKLYRCSNTMATTRAWVDVSGSGDTALPNASVNTIARDPYTSSIWYVGSDVGVFMTNDSGGSWSNIGAPKGLPNVQVNQLKCISGSGYLYAATWGRGMWRIKIQNTNYAPITSFKIVEPTIFAGKTTQGVVTLAFPPERAQSISISGGDGVVKTPTTAQLRASASQVAFELEGEWLTAARSANIVVSTSEVTSSSRAAITVQPIRDADFVAWQVPTVMEAGHTYPVTITMRNAGSIVWTAAARDRLASLNDNFWGPNRAYLTSTDQIGHDGTKTFTLNVTAPTRVGTYPFQWRMIQDGAAYYGHATPLAQIEVVEALNKSEFVAQAFSTTTMGAGNMYKVNVRYRNTGRGDWTRAAGHKLASSNPRYNSTWGFDRAVLGRTEVIEPGGEKTFELWVTAPTTNGSYNFQWQMQQEGVEWFGPTTPNQVVTVVAPTEKAQFVSQSVPTTVSRNAVFTVSITMKNTGSVAWTQTGNYRLMSWNPMGNSTWTTTRVVLATGESVAPGDSKTFAFTCTAPRNAGTYNFQWRMTREARSIFGDTTVNVPIVVKDAR